MTNTCFVVMPIGTQTFDGKTIQANDLRKKYDYIIKEAILKADPTLEVIRADEELNPSSMSNDIFMKLMHSKYVIADISYPNPNVFYELGIRHAISTRTILIRENTSEKVPFDIAHLRYIEYTQDPGGMDALATELKKRFSFYSSNPGKPDNQFLELSMFTNFVPDVFKNKKNVQAEALEKLLTFTLRSPGLLSVLMNGSEEDQQQALITALAADPDTAIPMLQLMLGSGT